LIGQQLCECLDNLPLLTALYLNFSESEMSPFAWRVFSQGSVLPSLQRLYLDRCKVSVKDFSRFVLKHCTTLLRLFLWDMCLVDGSLEELRGFFTTLRGSSSIEYLELLYLYLDEDPVEFSSTSQAIGEDLEDEPEYVWVTHSHVVVFEGTKEVRDGLEMMGECMRIT
jgi:hypothetical protein